MENLTRDDRELLLKIIMETIEEDPSRMREHLDMYLSLVSCQSVAEKNQEIDNLYRATISNLKQNS